MHLQHDKVACVPLFDPDHYGSIIIPDTAKERCDQGLVKYIGPEVTHVQPGDHIIFSGYTGTLMEIEGEGLMIVLPETFIDAKLESPDTSIPGLYFLGKDGEYFPATYEMAMNIIARGLKESPHFRDFKVFNVRAGIHQRPKWDKVTER